MGTNVKVKFVAVDLLPHEAPCAVLGEADDLTYLISRAHSPNEIAEGLTRLYERLGQYTAWRVEDSETA